MSIASEFESLFSKLKSKVGGDLSELESHFQTFIGKAKEEEQAVDSKVQDEITHLESLGYSVTKAAVITPAPVPPQVDASGTDLVDSSATGAAVSPAPAATGSGF